jgi:hypothetical protein
VELIRLTDSYYSNLIEGHSTQPVEIEQAMCKDYAEDPAKRNLQLESLAHAHMEIPTIADNEKGLQFML